MSAISLNYLHAKPGSRENPLRVTRAEITEFIAWRKPMDLKLEKLPTEKQEAFIAECRAECAKKWPRFFPGAYIQFID